MYRALLGDRVYRMLVDACDPMARPVIVFRQKYRSERPALLGSVPAIDAGFLSTGWVATQQYGNLAAL